MFFLINSDVGFIHKTSQKHIFICFKSCELLFTLETSPVTRWVEDKFASGSISCPKRDSNGAVSLLDCNFCLEALLCNAKKAAGLCFNRVTYKNRRSNNFYGNFFVKL